MPSDVVMRIITAGHCPMCMYPLSDITARNQISHSFSTASNQWPVNDTYLLFPRRVGESRCQQRGNSVVTSLTTWRDRKFVYIMSTNSSPMETITVKRQHQGRHH